MKPVVRVAVAVVVVAAAIGAGVAIGAARGGDEPAPTSTPTPSASAQPSSGGLVAGGGGSGKAADGKTPIRFASSCDGAAQAAAAYSVGLTDEIGYARPGVAGTKRAGLNATLDYIFSTGGSPDESVVERRTVLLTPNETLPGLTAHPEWGGYKVVDCVPKFSATINLFSCLTGYPDSDGGSICDTTVWELTWYADDWHVARIPATTVTPDPTSVFPDSVKAPNPVPAASRRAALAAGGAGWTEWANAPK
ncbi:hypothetical protein AB0H36_27625 [Kribbella sp. NPDC050820]|uniref:hypothetical protein n=1 Tax=Kribbella sp. NPDC050820 TaxID=3155408 RepID=UPI00340A0DBC